MKSSALLFSSVRRIGLFAKRAGIYIFSTVQAAFMIEWQRLFLIFFCRKPIRSWSNPAASGVAVVGFTILVGVALIDAIIFLANDESNLCELFLTGQWRPNLI
jgi:lipid-binding SYLF domain-containing protein